LAQLVVQLPHAETESSGASQPLASMVSQLPKPGLQVPSAQELATHWPLAFAYVQGLLQNPQFAAELVVSVSQPFAACMSQSAVPAAQLETPHTPLLQTGVPVWAMHTIVQLSQWFGSALRLTSHPLIGSPSQFS
jgi:hypothetical protein